jgi:hypothetical protein
MPRLAVRTPAADAPCRQLATYLPLADAATVLFPIEMYRKLHRPGRWETIRLEALNLFCCLITICAIIGSVQLIVRDASTYTFF